MNFKWPFLILFFASCTTPYQPIGKRGGYSEKKINEHVFRVTFQGNSRTKDEKVYKYFLKRCAELTQQNGYNFFIIISTEDKSRNSIVLQEGTPKSQKTITTKAYSSDKGFIPNEHKIIVNHIIVGEIAMFKQGEEPIDSFNAKEVLQSIRK